MLYFTPRRMAGHHFRCFHLLAVEVGHSTHFHRHHTHDVVVRAPAAVPPVDADPCLVAHLASPASAMGSWTKEGHGGEDIPHDQKAQVQDISRTNERKVAYG